LFYSIFHQLIIKSQSIWSLYTHHCWGTKNWFNSSSDMVLIIGKLCIYNHIMNFCLL